MVIGDDQKLGVILSDDDTGTAACGLLGLRSLGTVTEHAEVVLYFLYGLVCDGRGRDFPNTSRRPGGNQWCQTIRLLYVL